MAAFTVVRAVLLPALIRAGALVDGKSPAPILSTARVTVDGMGMSIASTDLNIFFEERVDAIPRPKWTACLPIGALSGFVKTLTAGGPEVEFTVQPDGARVEVRQGPTAARLSILDAADFPAINSITNLDHDAVLVELDAPILAAAIGSVIRCTPGSKEVRGFICGIHLNGSLIETTDGHRAALQVLPVELPTATIPTPTCTLISSLLRGLTGPATLGVSSRLIELRCAGWCLRSRLVEEGYPDFHSQIMPEQRERPTTVDRAALIAAVSRTLLFKPPGEKFFPVYLAAINGEMLLRSGGANGETEDLLPITGGDICDESGPKPIALNPAYMLDALAGLSADRVEIHVVRGAAGAWFCAAGCGDRTGQFIKSIRA